MSEKYMPESNLQSAILLILTWMHNAQPEKMLELLADESGSNDQPGSTLQWENERKASTFSLLFMYFTVLSSFLIVSGVFSWIAFFSINQGEISALTSSGILERRLVFWFIITQVLSHLQPRTN